MIVERSKSSFNGKLAPEWYAGSQDARFVDIRGHISAHGPSIKNIGNSNSMQSESEIPR
jgi:hypothetical protein